MRRSWKELFETLLEEQEKKLLKCGQSFIPNLTSDDILQPNDYPELEYNPHFRYEEGVLEGMRTAYTALRTPHSAD